MINFKHDIDKVNWEFLNRIDSADEKFTQFETKYHEIYEKHFPTKPPKKRKRKCDKPWILPWLQGACDRKNRFYKEFIKHPTLSNKLKYIKMKKFVTKHIKKAKRKYYQNYFQQYSSDGRKKWQMINNLLNRNTKSNIGITKIIDKDKVLTKSEDIAQTFNNFFCTVAQRLKDNDQSSSTPDCCRSPEHTFGISEIAADTLSFFYSPLSIQSLQHSYLHSLLTNVSSSS